MARKTKKRVATKAVSTVATPEIPPPPVGSPQILLDALVLRGVSYRELPDSGAVQPLAPGERVELDIKLEGKVTVFTQGVELYVTMNVTPKPAHAPVEIEVVYSALFRRPEGISQDNFLKWARGPAVRIVFPYLRETVANLAMRGRFGPLLLDPVVIGEIETPVSSPRTEDANKM